MTYKVQKPCRICGKIYSPCSDCENDKHAFHWRTVACSKECAMEYFKKIEESRKPQNNTYEVSTIDMENNKNTEESEQIE